MCFKYSHMVSGDEEGCKDTYSANSKPEKTGLAVLTLYRVDEDETY